MKHHRLILKQDMLAEIAVGTGTWGIAAVIPKYLSQRLHSVGAWRDLSTHSARSR